MPSFLLFLLLLLNLVISVFNAYSVGRYWTERGQLPTWSRIMMWSGAIMSVCGFFVVYVTLLTMVMSELHAFEFLAQAFLKIKLEPGEVQELVQTIFEIAYLGVIFPILGTGLAITVNSWVVAAAKRDPGSIGLAIYNTGAQVHNLVSAVRNIPRATQHLSGGLKIKFGKDSGKAFAYLALLLLPIVISLGGALASTTIIMRAADNRYEMDDLAS